MPPKPKSTPKATNKPRVKRTRKSVADVEQQLPAPQSSQSSPVKSHSCSSIGGRGVKRRATKSRPSSGDDQPVSPPRKRVATEEAKAKRAAKKLALQNSKEESHHRLVDWLTRLRFIVYDDILEKGGGTTTTASTVTKQDMIQLLSWSFSGDENGFAVLAETLAAENDEPLAKELEGSEDHSDECHLDLQEPPSRPLHLLILRELEDARVAFQDPKAKIAIPKSWKQENSYFDGLTSTDDATRGWKYFCSDVNSLQGSTHVRWFDDIDFPALTQTVPHNWRLGNIEINDGLAGHRYSFHHLLNGSNLGPTNGEAGVVKSHGPLFAFLRTPISVTTSGCSVPFPLALTPFCTRPRPDTALRMSLDENKVHGLLSPICWIEESKLKAENNVPAQVALALHPSLILLVIYYLSNRQSIDEPFPRWLFIYGIVHDEAGILIYAHYPEFVFDDSSDGRGAHWKFHSHLVSDAHQNAFLTKDDWAVRWKLTAAMLKMQAHATFLTKQFREWTLDPVLFKDLLDATAYFSGSPFVDLNKEELEDEIEPFVTQMQHKDPIARKHTHSSSQVEEPQMSDSDTQPSSPTENGSSGRGGALLRSWSHASGAIVDGNHPEYLAECLRQLAISGIRPMIWKDGKLEIHKDPAPGSETPRTMSKRLRAQDLAQALERAQAVYGGELGSAELVGSNPSNGESY